MRSIAVSVGLLLGLVACGGAEGDLTGDHATGGDAPVASGGEAATTGGAAGAATGGASTGGTSTGGAVASTGGAATGGTVATGGSVSSGGSTGGTATGGAVATGGARPVASGGVGGSTGGFVSTGGKGSAAGASTGGSVATGGAAGCACTTGVCCDGCNLRPYGFVTGEQALVSYCDSVVTPPAFDILRQEFYPMVCTGVSATVIERQSGGRPPRYVATKCPYDTCVDNRTNTAYCKP